VSDRPGAGGQVVRARAVVSGRVQGVWYRESCRLEADRLGVTGWVRNQPDGTVELEAEGAPAAVDALLVWARQGPPRAAVSTMTIDDVPPRGGTGFRVEL
jgi:acylphosphatase